MREVIRIQDTAQVEEKPVEFTHYLSPSAGWMDAGWKPNAFEKIVYLGNCNIDGDLFATYLNGTISVYKGHLNSGKY
jgi:hypothetical protein